MAFHWVPPPPGTLKINVHGKCSSALLSNGNSTGIRAIYRNHSGSLIHVTVGVIPELSPLGNHLWAIYAPLRRAFMNGYKDVIIETDNLEAYKHVREYRNGAPAQVFDVIDQIDKLIQNRSWSCSISYIFPARNRVARYIAKLAMEVGDRLYTLDRPIAGVEELMDWDLGLGVDHPDYFDVVLPLEAQDPINFDIGPTLVDQVDNLGLGQIGAPSVVNWDREEDESQFILYEAQEANFRGSHAFIDGELFSRDPPGEDVNLSGQQE